MVSVGPPLSRSGWRLSDGAGTSDVVVWAEPAGIALTFDVSAERGERRVKRAVAAMMVSRKSPFHCSILASVADAVELQATVPTSVIILRLQAGAAGVPRSVTRHGAVDRRQGPVPDCGSAP